MSEAKAKWGIDYERGWQAFCDGKPFDESESVAWSFGFGDAISFEIVVGEHLKDERDSASTQAA